MWLFYPTTAVKIGGMFKYYNTYVTQIEASWLKKLFLYKSH